MAAFGELERRFQSLLLLELALMQPLIYYGDIFVNILFHDLHYLNELFDSLAYVIS